MFDKRISIKIDADHFKILDEEILKTASDSILPSNYRYDPDFVYMLVRGVSAGEYWGPNNNHDFFEEQELIENHDSFRTDSKVYKNHENKDVEKALGDVVVSEWDPTMKGVNIVMRVDKKLAPEITRGLLKGTITDVSMGCRVDHVICSYCGNRAKTRKDYCEHLLDPKIRGKIMPNGVRVYEINKRPRFHDISIVTKGADRTAKAITVIDGEKAVQEEQLKKVASMNMEERIAGIALTKKFIPNYPIDPYDDLGFKKVASEKKMIKLAEIDKIVKGNIVAILNAQKTNEAVDSFSEISDTIRLFHTKYWDDETIDELVEKINSLAKRNAKSPDYIFKTFLRTAELAGIELTPMEYSKIRAKLEGADISDLELISEEATKKADGKTIKIVVSNFREGSGHGQHMFPSPSPLLEGSIFDEMLAPFMDERSIRPANFVPRMMRIVNEDRPPFEDNLKQFVLPMISRMPIGKERVMIIKMAGEYADYQNERAALYGDPNFEKYASLISSNDIKGLFKEAGYLGYAALSIPTVYGYSAYQRSKMLNGEPISGFNRYLAENPGNAATMVALAPFIKRKMLGRAKNELQSAVRNTKDIAGKTRDFAKSKYDSAIDFVNENRKYDSRRVLDENLLNPTPTKLASDFSLFQNEKIDTRLKEAGYSSKQVAMIKLAMVDYFVDDEAACDDILKSASIGEESPVEAYLKIAEELITIELEKIANDALDITRDTFADTLFYPKGAAAGTLLPGSMIDGFIFNKITKALEKKTKKMQPAVQPLVDNPASMK